MEQATATGQDYKFSRKTHEMINEAELVASHKNHQIIEMSHVFLAIQEVYPDLLPLIFDKSTEEIGHLNDAAELIYDQPKVSGSNIERSFSIDARNILVKSEIESKLMEDEETFVWHVVLSMLKHENNLSSMLRSADIFYDDVLKRIEELNASSSMPAETKGYAGNYLDSFSTNLNEKARNGEMDPVIGRDDEIRRVINILSRRTKNNPLLIGETGVGKRSIVEGMVLRIVNGDVPESLKGKEIYSINISHLVAGAAVKGEFEERLKNIVRELKESSGDKILFLNEAHMLVGAGASGGSMDAANILKPEMARGGIRMIASTTPDEAQKYLEGDKSFERMFQKIKVDEPKAEEALSILRGIKNRYEVHHQVNIDDDALIAAIKLSKRYINDRFLPDKAIDLIDEAASKIRVELESVPEIIDDQERRMKGLLTEREHLKGEGEQSKVDSINEKIGALKESSSEIKMAWELEKALFDKIQALKKEIEGLKTDKEKAQRESDFETVSHIEYDLMKKAEKDLEAKDKELRDHKEKTGKSLIKEIVEEEDIAAVVSDWTGVPTTKMVSDEKKKLAELENMLHKRVIGQHEPIVSVSNAIRRSRMGMGDKKRPIGSFIFLGPTGVGKCLHGDSEIIVDVDEDLYKAIVSIQQK